MIPLHPPAPPPSAPARKRKMRSADAAAAGAPGAGVAVTHCDEKKAKVAPATCHIECQVPTNWGHWFTPAAALNIAVGERIALRVVPDNLEALTNPVWALPNHHVHDYTALGDNAAATGAAAVTPTDPNRREIRFHWTSAGAKTVRLALDINGVAGAPTNDGVQVNVAEPQVVMARVIRRVVPRIRNQGGLRYLYLNSNHLTGVTLRFEARRAACGVRETTGRIAGVQLVNCADYHVADTRQIAWNYPVLAPAVRVAPGGAPPVGQHYMQEQLGHTGGAFALDTVAPYANSVVLAGGGATTRWDANDSPNLPLYPSLTKAVANSQFRVYFMYKSAQPGSIWVSLRRAVWSWGGQVLRGAAGPAWPNNTVINNPDPAGPVPINADGAGHPQHPTWNAVADAQHIAFVQYTNNPHI